jgi:hypothetical protein
MQFRTLYRGALAALLPVVVVAGLSIAPAWAKPSKNTLHFFQKAVSSKLTDPSGKPASAPAVGDAFAAIDLDYLGNHKHHAKHFLASDHIRCVFLTVSLTGPSKALCDAQLAIGGSMILADHVVATLSPALDVVPINGGTGVYRGIRGKATARAIGNTGNNDLTVVIRR